MTPFHSDAIFEFLWLSPLEAPFFRCLFHEQVLPHEILTIKHGYSSAAFPLSRHLYEGNASRLPALSVLDNVDRHDIPGFREKCPEFILSSLVREVGYVNLSIHVASFEIPDLMKHPMHSSFLSSGGRTGVMTSFPQPEHMTL
jgi:hypothetical protein